MTDRCVLPGVPLSDHREHVGADGGIVNVARHLTATQVAEDGQGEGVAHRVHEQVRNEGGQRFPACNTHTQSFKIIECNRKSSVSVDFCVFMKVAFWPGLTEEHGAGALTQQGEVRVRAGLHQRAVTQEDEGDRSRQRDVETLSGSLQNLLAGHSLVARVNHKRDAGVSGTRRGKQKHLFQGFLLVHWQQNRVIFTHRANKRSGP